MVNKLPGEFGAALRVLRLARGLKVYELAKKVGISAVYITQIEKHNKLPSSAVMLKIHNEINQVHLLKQYLKLKYPEMMDIIKAINKGS